MEAADFTARLPTLFTVDQNGCWNWAMFVADTGYGKVYYCGRKRQAHRVTYETLVGPVPDGLDLDHLCRNRACINPAHLEPVTRAVNLFRGNRNSEAFAAAFAKRTHCQHGHALVPSNLGRAKSGARRCLECSRDACRASRTKRRGGIPAMPLMRDRTHCPQGHPYSGENLRIEKNGSRTCVACKREGVRRSRERRREMRG